MALPAGIYLSLNTETKQDGIQNAKTPLSGYEKTALHGIAASDAIKDDLKENLTILGKEVAQLRAEVLALRTDMQAQKSTLISSNKIPAQEQKDNLQTLTEMHAKEDKRVKQDDHIKEQGEVLEAGFRQQTADPKWSAKAKSLVHDALASDNVASKDIIDIECRSSMCRVELANDTNSQEPSIAEFPMKIGEELPNIMVNQTNEKDGSTSTVLYLSKNGFVFPKPGN